MKWQEWTAVADNPSLWKNRKEKGLLKAEHVRDYVLRLWFEEEMDVSIYDLDFRPLVVEDNPGGAFEPLKDPERFKKVLGEYALIWPNPETGAYDEQAIDLTPECVRFFCAKYGKTLKVPKKANDHEKTVETPEEYQLYWVAYFDLLGFKRMVQQRTIREVHKLYTEVLDEVRQKFDMRDIERAWFSDTFLFYQKDDDSRDPLRIVGAAAQFFRSMLEKSIAIRGCLAHGEFYAGSQSELFGPALIAAYEEGERQDWLGFIIHRSAEKRMKQWNVNGRSVADMLQAYDYTCYDVPFKQKSLPHSHGSQPSESDKQLVYTISPLRDAGKPSDWWAHLYGMQREADDQIVKTHDAMACPACENERTRVRRKYENSKEFIRDIVSKRSNADGVQGRTTPEAPAGS